MISRRSIRIKVLQALYSQIVSDNENIKEAYKIYDQSTEQVLEVNLCYLLYCKEIFIYLEEFAKQQSEKFLISKQDKEVNTLLLKGHFYKFLDTNEEFIKQCKKYKTHQYIQSEFVREMFFKLTKLNEYKTYLESPSIYNEKNLINTFLKRILFKNEELNNYLESSFANIDEDSDLVHFSLKRSLKNFDDTHSLNISLGFKEWKMLESFAYDLIKVTLEHHAEYMKYIEPKLTGWEADRIPVLDLTIIKMSISEMLHFPTIPLKVTVNEYIDLTKIFCSMKSKDFVNGIMDRIMKEFQSNQMILKTGRGLD